MLGFGFPVKIYSFYILLHLSSNLAFRTFLCAFLILDPQSLSKDDIYKDLKILLCAPTFQNMIDAFQNLNIAIVHILYLENVAIRLYHFFLSTLFYKWNTMNVHE